MSIEFHRAVHSDLAEAILHHDSVSPGLGNDLLAEFKRMLALAARNSDRFHFVRPGVHRANLKRFPYHFLYRKVSTGVRITIFRHNRRDPNFGLERE